MSGAGVGIVVPVVLVVTLVVLGGIGALFVLLFSVGARRRRRQLAELTAYAAARGFSLRPGDPTLVDRFRGDPFGRGHGRVVVHVLEGVHAGRPVMLSEYRFTTGSGDDSRRHVFQVLATALPAVVPRLELAPSSAIGTFVDTLSGREHRIGDPVFDAAYRVFTDSPPFAADVLDPALRSWLMSRRPPFTRWWGGDLVVLAPGSLTPFEADRMLAYAGALLDRVPARVWERARGPLS